MIRIRLLLKTLLYNEGIKATVWFGKEGNLYVIQRKRILANVFTDSFPN